MMNTNSCEVYNPEDSFIKHIHKLQNLMNKLTNKLLHKHKLDIKAEQIPVLMATYIDEPLSQAAICQLIDRDKSSVQRSITSLTEKGLIKWKVDKTDNRKKIVSTTPKGAKYAQKIQLVVVEVDTHFQNILGSKSPFMKSIIKIEEAMQQLINE